MVENNFNIPNDGVSGLRRSLDINPTHQFPDQGVFTNVLAIDCFMVS